MRRNRRFWKGITRRFSRLFGRNGHSILRRNDHRRLALEWQMSAAGLLEHGEGRCGAWGLLLQDVCKAQGIQSVQARIVIHDLAYLIAAVPGSTFEPLNMFIENWDVSPCPTGGAPINQDGIAAQGNSNPDPTRKQFGNHMVVVWDNGVYDPSYGRKYATASSANGNLRLWEEASIALFTVKMNGNLTYILNDPITWQTKFQ